MTTAAISCLNFARTEAIEAFVREKFEPLVNRLLAEKVRIFEVRLSMSNSPEHPGEDRFSCQVHLVGRRITELFLSKSSDNLYRAIAAVAKAMHGVIPKLHGRARERSQKLSRRPSKWTRWRGVEAELETQAVEARALEGQVAFAGAT